MVPPGCWSWKQYFLDTRCKIMLYSLLICSTLTLVVCPEWAHGRRSSRGNLDTYKHIIHCTECSFCLNLLPYIIFTPPASSPSNGLWSASTGLMAGTNGTGIRLSNTTFILVQYSHLLSCPACSCPPCSGRRSRSRKPWNWSLYLLSHLTRPHTCYPCACCPTTSSWFSPPPLQHRVSCII